ncbi:hypothetical protein B0H13DRAFT_2321852 [Mycena leptocephala]|nr:hypothetical protein B0H13DRAFT_2321852 [Mycena leptocephala]
MDKVVAKHRKLTNLHEGAAKHSQASVVWAEPTTTPPPTKVPTDVRTLYEDAVRAVGVSIATVNKVERAATTIQIMGKAPGLVHPSLLQVSTKQGIITALKRREPGGDKSGWEGLFETTTSLGAEAQSEYKSLQRGFASTYRNIEGAVARVVSEHRFVKRHRHVDTYHDISRGELSSATNATKDLAEHGAKADTSTGSTPRKRVRQISWE